MQFSLDDRTCALSVGEFAGFTLGPRDAGVGGPAGVWRAQLGQQWHARLRVQAEQQAAAEAGTSAAFEVPLHLGCVHGGWRLTFTGRVDQLVATADAITVREIKTVSAPLPADERILRADYPDYFLQLLTYLALLRSAPQSVGSPESNVEGQPLWPSTLDARPSTHRVFRAELVFVEVGSGITQPVAVTADDEALFRAQLERLVEFLNLRLRARERLRDLRFRPAFAVLRPGQETIQDELAAALGGPVESRASKVEGSTPPLPTLGSRPSTILFEAPTGYGKTGVLLEFALGLLRDGRFSRLLYLTGKSTGQLQVMRTLAAMTEPDINPEPKTQNAKPAATPVAAWQVRPKSEHCINTIFHCLRDACPYLADLEARWAGAGLARFYLRDDHPHDLETLRTAGRDARLCPYEITRAALPFNDVWIGDYNYVFAPDSRGVFFDRPGFNPAETLLVIDEAHNLPARVADAWSHVAAADAAEAILTDLHHVHAPASLLLAWQHWADLLHALKPTDQLDPATEEEIRGAIDRLASLVATTALDYAALGPRVGEGLWETLALRDWLAGDFSLPESADSAPSGSPAESSPKGGSRDPASDVTTLLWSQRPGELHFTCLDAAPLIGQTLRAFGAVILASATLQPAEAFATACGLGECETAMPAPEAGTKPLQALGKLSRRARKALRGVTSGAALLQVEEARDAAWPRLLVARAPWRDHAYRVGVDTRVDTTFQHRSRHYAATADTVEALCRAAAESAAAGHPPAGDSGTAPVQGPEPRVKGPGLPSTLEIRPSTAGSAAVAVFFPSYAYAESISRALQAAGSAVRAALQPRSVDLAAQTAWVNESLAAADALFLVLGSSFAESIDLLGGRVSHAMVVGPALPEVNALQRRRLAEQERAGLSRDGAFRRVYQIPGMQKVNQALGRLVRAPGQRATVLLHCRRFAAESYASLLAPEYRGGEILDSDDALRAWLGALW